MSVNIPIYLKVRSRRRMAHARLWQGTMLPPRPTLPTKPVHRRALPIDFESAMRS